MGWKSQYEQQKIALRRVFYMFTSIALMLTALSYRQRGWTVSLAPGPTGGRHAGWVIDTGPDNPPPCDLYPATQALLIAARLVLARIDAITRSFYELMNRAHMFAHWLGLSAWVYPPSNQCQLPGKRFDSS